MRGRRSRCIIFVERVVSKRLIEKSRRWKDNIKMLIEEGVGGTSFLLEGLF
jgi:hypothetical protein